MSEAWDEKVKRLQLENAPDGEGWEFVRNCTSGEKSLDDYLNGIEGKRMNQKETTKNQEGLKCIHCLKKNSLNKNFNNKVFRFAPTLLYYKSSIKLTNCFN